MIPKTLEMNLKVLAIVLTLVLSGPCKPAMGKTIFPGKEWKKKDPEKMGLNVKTLDRIDSLMQKTNANGVLIYKGCLVGEWNYGKPVDQRFEVQSVTKSITSTILALALQDGLIPSLDAKVKDHYPDFEAGPYTHEIAFRHLVTASSGVKSLITAGRYYDPNNMKPGIESRYHNTHFHHLATALSYLYGKDLGEVMNERILTPIQARDTMVWGHHNLVITCANGKEVKVVGGYAFSNWTARDLARVGYLYLHDGKWKRNQLIPAEYAREARMPIPIPVMDMSPDAPASKESTNKYGLAWRGRPFDNGRTLWYMSGNGGQFCVVIPEYDLVMTKINSYSRQPQMGIEQFEELLWNILKK